MMSCELPRARHMNLKFLCTNLVFQKMSRACTMKITIQFFIYILAHRDFQFASSDCSNPLKFAQFTNVLPADAAVADHLELNGLVVSTTT